MRRRGSVRTQGAALRIVFLAALLAALVAGVGIRLPGAVPAELADPVEGEPALPRAADSEAVVVRRGPPRPTAAGSELVAAQSEPAPAGRRDVAVFAPAPIALAPAYLRDSLEYGRAILVNPAGIVPDRIGNELSCASCHFEAGAQQGPLSFVGVAAVHPAYVEREQRTMDLVERTNACFRRSLNGKPLPAGSREMRAIITYYQWLSAGIPIYADVPWLGLRPLRAPSHAASAAAGARLVSARCAKCHGERGLGAAAPPLWGHGSFSAGASMARAPVLAAFVRRFMPRDNPTLTVEQALDVALWVTSRPRPHFTRPADAGSR